MITIKKNNMFITANKTPNIGDKSKNTITDPPAVPAEPRDKNNLNNLLLKILLLLSKDSILDSRNGA